MSFIDSIKLTHPGLRSHKKYIKPLFAGMVNPTIVEIPTLLEFQELIGGCCTDMIENEKATADQVNKFKGDAFEIFCELWMKLNPFDPISSVMSFKGVWESGEEDQGVDGIGVNAAGRKCAVQVKYRSNPMDTIDANDLKKTISDAHLTHAIDFTDDNRHSEYKKLILSHSGKLKSIIESGVNVSDLIDLNESLITDLNNFDKTYTGGTTRGENLLVLFTNCDGVTDKTKDVFRNTLHVINGTMLSRRVDGNVNFWEICNQIVNK